MDYGTKYFYIFHENNSVPSRTTVITTNTPNDTIGFYNKINRVGNYSVTY